MADVEFGNISCVEPPNEHLKLYCVNCEDIVCLYCITEIHNGHKYLKIPEVKNILESKLHKGCEQLKTDLDKLQIEVSNKIARQNEEKTAIQSAIKESIDKLKVKLDEQEASLASKAHILFDEFKKPLYKIEEQLTLCGKFVTEAFDVHASENKENLDIVLKKYTTQKHVEKMLHFTQNFEEKLDILLKVPEIQNGEIEVSTTKLKPENEDLLIEIRGKYSETECSVLQKPSPISDNSDTKEIANDFDFSSDDVINEGPTIIHFPTLEKPVQKLVPISNTKAWIKVKQCLYHLDQDKMAAIKCESKVDDFSVFKDGSLLILNTSDHDIRKRLKSGKLLKFTSVKPHHPVSIDIDGDRVAVLIKDQDYFSKIDRYHIVLFCIKGIKTRVINNVTSQVGFDIKVTPQNEIFSLRISEVLRLNLDSGKEAEFRGIFGFEPANTFFTGGLSLCPDNGIVVSDINHPAIILLDDDLKFKKCLLDGSDNIKQPSVLAFHNDRLWVVDGNRILIFDNKIEFIKNTADKK